MAHQLCKRCQVPKDWSGDDRKCSFPAGEFSSDGWNCGTANALRDLAERGHDELRQDCWRTRYDDESIGVIAVPEDCDVDGWFVVLTWYKDRGRTGMAVVMGDEKVPTYLKLSEAESILDAMGKPTPAA